MWSRPSGPCSARTGRASLYLYIPHLDQAAHEHGPWSAEANQALRGIDRLFGVLAHELRGQATVALSADHGHLGVGPEELLLIREDDGLPELLAAEPAGDSRVLHFHVRPGAAGAFAARFRELFGEEFLLLRTQEVDELRLLGPEPLSPLTAARLGDFVAISRGAHVLGYHPANGARELLRHASHHSGLRPGGAAHPTAARLVAAGSVRRGSVQRRIWREGREHREVAGLAAQHSLP